LFERRRSEAAVQDKVSWLAKEARKHPQAESLVAAVLAEGDLFDGLRRKLRPEGIVIDEYGRQVPGAVAEPIYSLENVSALHVVLSLITGNGGNPITLGEHAVLPDGLPALPQGSLSQLRRNGWITTSQEGAGTRVGLGERARGIAARWGIDVPADGND
jgi:hypothetical protein